MEKYRIDQIISTNNELEELSSLDRLLEGKHKDNVNFVIKQHHGDTSTYDEVSIDKRHTARLLVVVREIEVELKEWLKSL